MGKIKVRILGTDQEEIQKQESRLASEAKRAKQKEKERSASRVRLGASRLMVKGTKGGERVVAVGPSEEELARLQMPSAQADAGQAKIEESKPKKGKKNFKKEKKSLRSKSYAAVAKTLDRSKKYSLLDGLEMLEKLKRSNFDETVELHINTTETGVSGNITFPHGTGKQIRVAIADDDVLAKVALGKIDFDILLATPIMMPKLARVAKILGPRGLMPNPKNATLVKDPEKALGNFKKGQWNFKTEAKTPIMHLAVGKMSFGAKKLSENIQTLLDAIKKEKIRNITLKSTMSPGIKLVL